MPIIDNNRHASNIIFGQIDNNCNLPLDYRCDAESIRQIEHYFNRIYDGSITYVRDIDTYLIYNNMQYEVAILRYEFKDTTKMLKEWKIYYDGSMKTMYDIKNTNFIHDIPSDNINETAKYLNICYDTENNYGTSSNPNTIFNKYMRGYDALIDIKNGIIIKKTALGDNNVIVDGDINKFAPRYILLEVKKLSFIEDIVNVNKNQFTMIRLIYNCISILYSAISSTIDNESNKQIISNTLDSIRNILISSKSLESIMNDYNEKSKPVVEAIDKYKKIFVHEVADHL